MKFAELVAQERAKAPLLLLGLIALHNAQQRVVNEAKRFNFLACGRRWGKTRLGVYLACKRLVIPSSIVGWFAPNYKYLSDAWDEIHLILKQSNCIESSNKTDKIIRLTNGSMIEFWTLEDEDAGRSRRYHRVIVDEVAKQVGMSGRWEKAIRPTLADFIGDAWFLSTPKGSTGFFFHGYQKGLDPDEKEYASWQMPTRSNHYIDGAEIDAAEKNSTPLIFRQEWLAEFVQPAGAVFDCFDARVETEETGPTNVVQGFKPHPERSVHTGSDFGSANTAAAIISEVKPGEYVAFASYHAAGDDATLHVERIKTKAVHKIASAWGGAPSEDDWRARYRKAGLHVRRPKIHAVDTGISTLYRMFREKKLKIDSSCTKLIEDILSYSYKVDGDDRTTHLLEDQSMYHRVDALRYVIVGLEGRVEPKRHGSRFDKPTVSERDLLPLRSGATTN